MQKYILGTSMNKSFAVILVALLFMMVSCIVVVEPVLSSVDVTEDTWVSKAPMQQARYNLGVAVVNGKIYAIGGNAEKGAVGTNEEYDPVTDTWSSKSPMPTPRYRFNLVIYQNKIYCIGGTTENAVSGVNEVYDPITDVWETKAAMPVAKSVDAVVVKDKIYLIGGGPNNTLNQVYDPTTDSWTIKAAMPNKAYGASVGMGNKIYVVGGSYSGDQFYTYNQIYDPETDTWSQGATPPLSGGVVRRSAIVTTGEFAPKRIYILDDALRVYSPENDNWTFGTKMPTARLNFAVALINDVLYAIGGCTFSYPDPAHRIGEDPIITIYATNEQYTPIGYGTPDPSFSPSPSPPSTETEPFPVAPVAAASVVTAAVVSLGLLIYFKKVIIKRK